MSLTSRLLFRWSRAVANRCAITQPRIATAVVTRSGKRRSQFIACPCLANAFVHRARRTTLISSGRAARGSVCNGLLCDAASSRASEILGLVFTISNGGCLRVDRNRLAGGYLENQRKRRPERTRRRRREVGGDPLWGSESLEGTAIELPNRATGSRTNPLHLRRRACSWQTEHHGRCWPAPLGVRSARTR